MYLNLGTILLANATEQPEAVVIRAGDRLLECDPARQSERTRVLPTIPGEIPDLRARPSGCVFAPRCLERHAGCDLPQVERQLGPDHAARCNLAGEPAQEGVDA